MPAYFSDIPGIIEGAHLGKGLGDRFLKHIERNACLLFLIAVDADDIVEQYKILLKELKLFNPDLLNKQRFLAITKSDLVDKEMLEMLEKDLKAKLKGRLKIDFIFISSATQSNIEKLKDELWKRIND